MITFPWHFFSRWHWTPSMVVTASVSICGVRDRIRNSIWKKQWKNKQFFNLQSQRLYSETMVEQVMSYNEDFLKVTNTVGIVDFLILQIWKTITLLVFEPQLYCLSNKHFGEHYSCHLPWKSVLYVSFQKSLQQPEFRGRVSAWEWWRRLLLPSWRYVAPVLWCLYVNFRFSYWLA
jgi:hypothetical protein